ncbi:DMT family transporter [Actinoallomurus rhizosphaericola]|uniref:DMT family transporter n=1 Tax=Actinoallomurus rhizosphaericola TaxID=2952536 RepID=UPI002093E613|nr:EamA family transporter [Actinoallomurus rhizosphaericola]MCO5996528.1 EamA family transporter [Actinoallomurus rhizosphaericola]
MTTTEVSSAAPAHRRLGGSADIVLAASLWGTTGTVRSFVHASPVAVGAARLLIGGAFLFAVAVRCGGLRPLLARGARTRLILLLGAALVAVYQVAFFCAVARTGVATGTVVTIGSGPVFAGLLSRLLRMGALTPRWLLSTAGAVAGCAALTLGGQAAGVEPLGVALALISGCGYAAYATVASYLITRGEDSRAVLGTLFGGSGVLLLPVLLVMGAGWLFTGTGAAAALYLGVITTGLGYLFYGRGLRTTPVAAATTLTLAEPAVAAVLGLFVLGEHLGALALAGLALLAASLLILTLPSRSH